MRSKQQIKQGFILATGEIFLKSEGVQKLLIQKLENNLKFFLKKESVDFKLHLFRQRIFLETKEIEKTTQILKNCFGLVWFSQCFLLKDFSLKQTQKWIKQNCEQYIKENQTFGIRFKKDSQIKESSEEIINTLAEPIKRKVDLSNPDKEIFIEARPYGYFIYFNKQQGTGGLPAGSQGKVLTLMSGGIDSPVASYLIAKRGAQNVWIHFHSFPLVSKASIDKTQELTQEFTRFQPRLKTYLVPFSEIQKKIKLNAPAKYRTLLYRRMMLKISETIAEREKCQALVTGEALGQVSSQTLTNLGISNRAVKLPILRPLIGMDKQEIMDLAKQIQTYDISIKPQEDCCTLFVSKGQTAQGDLKQVEQIEKDLELDKMIPKNIDIKEI